MTAESTPAGLPGAPSLRAVAVVPARWASTRLPGKMLADLAGRPLVVRVLERVSAAPSLSAVVAATDDERIADAVREAGFEALLTDPTHPTGTDRIGEVLSHLEADIILGVQGDEPEVEPTLLDALVDRLVSEPELGLVTPVVPWPEGEAFESPHRVKVVVDERQRALYFSRAPIPHQRDPGGPHPRWLHVGIYAWRRAALTRFLTLPRGSLEALESLEQLRALEHGIPVGTLAWPRAHGGIDTEADLAAVRARWMDAGPPSNPSPS